MCGPEDFKAICDDNEKLRRETELLRAEIDELREKYAMKCAEVDPRVSALVAENDKWREEGRAEARQEFTAAVHNGLTRMRELEDALAEAREISKKYEDRYFAANAQLDSTKEDLDNALTHLGDAEANFKTVQGEYRKLEKQLTQAREEARELADIWMRTTPDKAKRANELARAILAREEKGGEK